MTSSVPQAILMRRSDLNVTITCSLSRDHASQIGASPIYRTGQRWLRLALAVPAYELDRT
jgi:hypothetical protein